MNSYLVFGAIFIPLYLLYNYNCYTNKKVSMWMSSGNLEVKKEHFYTYQLNSSMFTCVLMVILILIATAWKFSSSNVGLLALIFYIVIIFIKRDALNRGLLKKIR